MKKLGFVHTSDHNELKFERGSSWVDEPTSQMYITARFDPANRKQLTASLEIPYSNVGWFFDWLAWTGVDKYYDSVLPLVEQLAVGNDTSLMKPFLQLSKRVGRSMIIVNVFVLIAIISAVAFAANISTPLDLLWLNYLCGVIATGFFSIRIGLDILGLRRIGVMQ